MSGVANEYGRTGREWRFCQVCQRADALRIRKLNGLPILQCAFCVPLGAKPVAIAAPAAVDIFS